ncbi:hypothetical protein FOZ70_04960 [Burkholderia sp. COPS]|uniref:gp53-like domain-containing protein n=1 Tax=Burkholderia sp. COPS TaxID=2597663 RepID=UPI001CA47561|nr:hypothetical protein [Burkholderia sp. COPS]MBW5804096.1 hypothetical protein [Burkholderia sp. COPS]
MANLAENSKWEEGIYQLETSDPVVGGPDGIDNVQPRQLANRTRYLKDQQEAHAAATNPHPQYAKSDSPAFTGSPQTPQAPQFDNTTKVASTSFVQRALGNFANVQVVNGVDTVLNASAFGCAVQFVGTSCTATLPSGNGANAGSAIHFYAQGGVGQTFTIKAPAGGFIYAPGAGFGTSNTSITLGPNDTVILVNRSGAEWDVMGGTWVLTNEAIAFNGKQSSVTQPQFDSGDKLATTAFVQRALGNFQAFSAYTSSQTLKAEQSGTVVNFWGGAASTFTLPACSAMPPGGAFLFNNSGSAPVTVARAGSDTILCNGNNSNVVVSPNDNLLLVAIPSNQWIATGGSAQLKYSTALSGANFTTAPQFDNSTKLATTAFVQRQGLKATGFEVYTATATLPSSVCGAVIYTGGPAAFTLTLPPAGGVPGGARIEAYSMCVGAVTFAAQGTDTIPAAGSKIVMNSGDTMALQSNGIDHWELVGGSVSLPYSSVMSGANWRTAPQFDSSNKLATTAFVQQASGNFQTRKYINGSATLANSDSGSWVEAGGTGPSAITLPAPTTNNISFTITNVTSNGTAVTILTPSASIYNQASAASTFLLDVGATVELTSDASNWTVISHYTRSPVAQTPVQFDNSSKLATTQFVQRALGNISGFAALNANTTLTAAQAGQAIQWYGAGGGVLTLPAGSSMPNGGVLTFMNFGTGPITVTTQGDDFIWSAGKVQPVTLQVGDSLVLVSRGVAEWDVTGGSAAIQFAQSRGVTASQFDNSTKLATTQFVQRALGNFSGVVNLSPVRALTVADLGKQVNYFGTADGTVSLPPVASIPAGQGFWITNTGAALLTVASNGSDTFAGTSGTSSLPVGINDNIYIVSSGSGSTWLVYGGSAQLKFTGSFNASLGGNGYQKLPSGLIIQWGNVSVPANSNPMIAFPVAFPNACLSLACASDDAVANGTLYRWTVGGKSKTTFVAANNWNGTISGSWIAIGF